MGMNRKWNMKVFELHDNEYALTTTVIFTINDGDIPIQNATVTLGNLTSTTDENGNCSFDNISLGEYEISVVIDGYQTISDTIIVTSDDTTFSISLEQEVEAAILQFTYDASVNQTFSSYNSYPFTFTGELEIDYGDGSTEVVIDNQSLSHTYSDTDTYTVTINGNITALNNSCFSGWGGLTNIIIPSTITNIGESCFAQSGLVEIDIPSSITTIANGMFTRCYDLTTINLPSTITSIGEGCFDSCSSLRYINIPNNVSNIGAACFQGSGLISIDIPSNVTNLPSACFSNCTNLTNVNALGVTSVGNACFYNCSGLESIYLSDDIISFNTICFQRCSNLRSISFSNNTTSLGEASFDGCDSLTSISIPTNITSIGQHCFVNCNNLALSNSTCITTSLIHQLQQY